MDAAGLFFWTPLETYLFPWFAIEAFSLNIGYFTSSSKMNVKKIKISLNSRSEVSRKFFSEVWNIKLLFFLKITVALLSMRANCCKEKLLKFNQSASQIGLFCHYFQIAFTRLTSIRVSVVVLCDNYGLAWRISCESWSIRYNHCCQGHQ